MTQPAERRRIPGHRQYEIDENGNIFRVEGRDKWKDPSTPITQSIQRIKVRESGYLYVTFVTRDDLDNNGNVIDIIAFRRVGVHKLMCTAFHGPAPEGKPFVRHLNGTRSDNRPQNVQWSATRSMQKNPGVTDLKGAAARINHARQFQEAPKAMITKFHQQYPLTMGEIFLPGK